MLYICPTPIGNLEDITIRVLKTLEEVDEVYCEDTRHSIKLLNHYEIKKPLFAMFEHDERAKSEEIIDKIQDGQSIAYICDAGMPGISDPAHLLIKLAIEENINFTVLPGPCAFVTGVVGSGLDTSDFHFNGFLEKTSNKRKEQLKKIKKNPSTQIFYVSPHKILSSLEDALDVLEDRKIVLARELSKIHENYHRMKISELINEMKNEKIPQKGEMVLIFEGNSKKDEEELTDEMIISKINELLNLGNSKKDAVKKISKECGVEKNRVYALSLEI